MTVLAEVVEESINGMETTMVSKAEQEKVCAVVLCSLLVLEHMIEKRRLDTDRSATIYPKSRFCPTEIRTPITRKERSNTNEVRKRKTPIRRREAKTALTGGINEGISGSEVGFEFRKGSYKG